MKIILKIIKKLLKLKNLGKKSEIKFFLISKLYITFFFRKTNFQIFFLHL